MGAQTAWMALAACMLLTSSGGHNPTSPARQQCSCSCLMNVQATAGGLLLTGGATKTVHDAVIGEILAVGENVDIGVTVGDKVIFRWALQVAHGCFETVCTFMSGGRLSSPIHQLFFEGLAGVRGVSNQLAVLPWLGARRSGNTRTAAC